MNDTRWTDERVTLLDALWRAGRSATQIAAEMGEGISRNAVIGKVHRLGLQNIRRGVPRVAETAAFARGGDKLAGRSAPAPEPKTAASIVEPSAEAELARFSCLGDALLALPDGPTCRWPMDIDDPADVRFCGARATCSAHPKSTHFVYCADHHLRSIGAGTASERRALRTLSQAAS